MYTVIIQNQKTIEEFTEFHPLFLEAFDKDQIGICKWNESGTTIDTALPDLSYLTDDKEEWKAVVVCLEGDGTGGEKADLQNPYDFEINKIDNNSNDGSYVKVKESTVPLIRLAQMLGGVPEPEVKFNRKIIEEENMAPRVVFEPEYNDDDKSEYERIKRKYRFDGTLPETVTIVTVRKDYYEDTITDNTWRVFSESKSSDFSRLNRYPSCCRFMVYDYKAQGNNKLELEKFRFWTAILILSLNKIDPSTLQAYRLYKFDIDMNKSRLEENMINTVSRLKSVSGSIERDLKRKEKATKDVNPCLPDFQISVDVNVESIDPGKTNVDKKDFGLFSEGILNETGLWTNLKNTIVNRLEKAVITAERTLDIKADQIRSSCVCTENDVIGLDRFQREDMEKKVDELYDSILNIQEKLPESLTDNETLNEKSNAVKKLLSKRFGFLPAMIVFAVTLVMLVLGFFTYLIDKTTSFVPDPATVVLIICSGIVLVLVISLFVVLIQKHKLNTLIKDFNDFLRNLVSRLNSSTSAYSEYLSSIASHTRGSTYLVESEKVDYYEESKRSQKVRHTRAISAFISKIRIWARAFNIKDAESGNVYDYIEYDLETKPAENDLYTFDFGSVYPVKLNDSGKIIMSPFSFVNKIIIEREEIYRVD